MDFLIYVFQKIKDDVVKTGISDSEFYDIFRLCYDTMLNDTYDEYNMSEINKLLLDFIETVFGKTVQFRTFRNDIFWKQQTIDVIKYNYYIGSLSQRDYLENLFPGYKNDFDSIRMESIFGLVSSDLIYRKKNLLP